MSITVQIPTALRRLTSGTPRVVCSAANLNELFAELDSQFPDLKPHLRDEAGETRRFLNIYVNEEDILENVLRVFAIGHASPNEVAKPRMFAVDRFRDPLILIRHRPLLLSASSIQICPSTYVDE